MLYRINEKGRYEAVTANGEVIGFDDFAEMVDFAALRGEVCYLVGKEEKTRYEVSSSSTAGSLSSSALGKTKVVKTRIFKGEYEYDGKKLIKKEKTA